MQVANLEPRLERQRQQLNTLIKKYASSSLLAAERVCAGGTSQDAVKPAAAVPCSQMQSGGHAGSAGSSGSSKQRLRMGTGRVALFDLASALPFESMPEEQQHNIWDDGLHLTMQGYDHMGELLLEALLPLVKEDLAGLQLSTPATS